MLLVGSERFFESFVDNAPTVIFSPKELKNVLAGVATWLPEEKSPVTTREFIAANLPIAALKLGIEPILNRKFARPSTLDLEFQIDFAIAILEQGDPDEGTGVDNKLYTREEILTAVKNQDRDGPYITTVLVEDAKFLLDMIEAGKVVVDPNKLDDFKGI